MRSPSVDAIERALYVDRTVVRMLGMRRTMFVLPVDLAGVVHAACSAAIARRERERLLTRIASTGVTKDPARWLTRVQNATLQALADRGPSTAAELAEDVPLLRTKVLLAPGKRYETRQSISVWVLLTLAAEGRIVRGRPRGSWTSSQYRWALMETWIPGGLAEWTVEDAQAEVGRRWLRSFGPGTVQDIRWWTGLTAREVTRALGGIDTAKVGLDGGETGLVLADDLEPAPEPEPWVALLPALDPTVMGWTRREWFLGEHGPALFDRNGNAGPTVWSDGRIVGGWAQRRDGEVVFRLLEDVGKETKRAVEAEAERLREWLGDVRITPLFRTPLERELSAD